jgi:hypothetical protein
MTQPSPITPEPGTEIICPFCASAETELFAMFGHLLLSSQYYCRSCRTVFDVVRWEEPHPPAPSPDRITARPEEEETIPGDAHGIPDLAV